MIATVVAGLLLGWYQHEIFKARGRRTGTAVWQVMVYLLEAFVFVLIGLSLRGVLELVGTAGNMAHLLGPPVLVVVLAVVLSRFAWILADDRLGVLYDRLLQRHAGPPSLAASTVMAWAGMLGVVTLAVALSLPGEMQGRDLILVSAFAVILVTVLLQGTTLGMLINLLGIGVIDGREEQLLTRAEAVSRMTASQFAAVGALARDADGRVRHPRLLEQYGFRASGAQRFSQDAEMLEGKRTVHFDVVLAAVAAGRAEVLKLHRSGQIHDEVLHALEYDLDLQEISAERMRGKL